MFFSNKPPKVNKTSKAFKSMKNNTKENISNTFGVFSGKTSTVKNNIKREMDDIKKIDFKKVPKKFYLYFALMVIALVGLTILLKLVFGNSVW